MKNKFVGALLGFVVGDVLGSPFEGIGAPDIKEQYGYIKGPVKANAYTDDTIMMKIVLDTILEEGKYNPQSVLKKYIENKDKMIGIGLTTYYALSHASLDDIYAGAKYASSMGYGFGNGPLMRISPIALYHFYSDDIEKFVNDIISETLLTHYTNKAVTSAVMFSKFLNSIGEGLSPEDSYLEALDLVHYIPSEFLDEKVVKIFEESLNMNIESLEPREFKGLITNTLRIAVISSFEEDFEETLLTIVNMGGDTDTNCAVSGAVLGIKLGYEAIPKEWLEYVSIKDEIIEKSEKLYDLAKSRSAQNS